VLALVPAAPAALEPVPPDPPEEAPLGDELSQRLLLGDQVSGRDQLLSLWERTLLFSTLDAAELRQALRWRVVDQDSAVDALCDEFALYAAGTHEVGRPASYFLVGPTGVGKNLLVETLVSLLGTLWRLEVPLLTLEGPNYTYPSDINELRGAARGFIRSDEQGLLSEFEERAAQSPLCVILVDEVEKAHSQLRKFFLSIMDRGTITDAHGRTLHFGNALLFFTSNIGYRPGAANSRPIGFGDDEAASEVYQFELARELKRTLSPEFINRLRVLRFRHLGRGSIEKIFDLEFEKIASRFRELHEIELVATPAAKEALIGRGYSREYGARHLAGVLHDLCNVAVSKMIRADDRNLSRGAGDALAYLREIREGERAYDPEEVQARVRRVARARVSYGRIVVDAEGERILYRPEGG
jgi:ATP-dependent Clp protease ATP-binding subunit ClpA